MNCTDVKRWRRPFVFVCAEMLNRAIFVEYVTNMSCAFVFKIFMDNSKK